jgi:anti-anti-sigma factor
MQEGSIFSALVDGSYVLKFIGDVRLTLCSSLDTHLENSLNNPEIKEILIDLTQVEGIDSTSLGLIAKLSLKAKERNLPKPALVSTNQDITRILLTMGFDHVFVLMDQLPSSSQELKQLPLVQESVEEMQQRIISAHKVLMDLNETNREAFKDLVSTLESIEK